MNSFSWHTVSPHPFGPPGFQAAICENYRPVAWVRDEATAEDIACASEYFFDKASKAQRKRRRFKRQARKPPGFFDVDLARELRRNLFGRAVKGISFVAPRDDDPMAWKVVSDRPDAPPDLPFALVDERGQTIGWVAEKTDRRLYGHRRRPSRPGTRRSTPSGSSASAHGGNQPGKAAVRTSPHQQAPAMRGRSLRMLLLILAMLLPTWSGNSATAGSPRPPPASIGATPSSMSSASRSWRNICARTSSNS
jgi:hypothetical protein